MVNITSSAHPEEGLSLAQHVLSACEAVEGTRLEGPGRPSRRPFDFAQWLLRMSGFLLGHA